MAVAMSNAGVKPHALDPLASAAVDNTQAIASTTYAQSTADVRRFDDAGRRVTLFHVHAGAVYVAVGAAVWKYFL
jgi:hypothetical protein